METEIVCMGNKGELGKRKSDEDNLNLVICIMANNRQKGHL